MNKVLTLAALLCMSVSGAAFSADDMMQQGKGMAKQEMKAEADKAMDKQMDKATDKAMDKAEEAGKEAATEATTEPKDAKAAKEMKPAEKMAGQQHAYKEITASELKNWMDSKEQLVLIDARDKKSFQKGHIEGAVNLAPDQITKKEMGKLAKSMDAKLVFYCGDTTCPSSKKGAEAAAKLGYTNVYKIPGGYAEWEKEGYQTTKKM